MEAIKKLFLFENSIFLEVILIYLFIYFYNIKGIFLILYLIVEVIERVRVWCYAKSIYFN